MLVALSLIASHAMAQPDHTYPPTSQPTAGLDIQIVVDTEESWPRITREIQLDVGRHIGPFLGGVETHTSRYEGPADLGMIRPVGAVNPRPAPVRRNWARSLMSFAYDGPDGTPRQMQVIVSRLTPAILVRADSDLDLMAGTKYLGQYLRRDGTAAPRSSQRQAAGKTVPAYAAFRAGQRIVLSPTATLRGAMPEGIERGWMLLWYGSGSFFRALTAAGIDVAGSNNRIWSQAAYKADSPLLVLFDSPVSSISIEDDALRVRFVSGRGNAFIVPIFGELLPPADETEKWKNALPRDVVPRCDWWAQHGGRFPLGVSESYGYDADSDTVTITQRFEFADFRADGSFAAPVSPILATANLEGFPMEFSAQVEDPGVVTAAGSWLAVPGVQSYDIRLRGLGKYAARRPMPAGPPPQHLIAELRDQVSRILAAGHLAPWYPGGKNAPGWSGDYQRYTQDLVHGYPGEVLAALAEALPYLTPPLRQQAILYMQRERREYPPETIDHLLGGQGARRESYAFTFSEEFLADNPPAGAVNNINTSRRGNFFVRHKMPHPLAIYQLAAYYDAVGRSDLPEKLPGILAVRDPWTARADWATGGTYQWPGQISVYSYPWGGTTVLNTSIWHGNGGVIDANYFLAASIGQIRLARLAGDAAAEREGWGLLAKSAARRYALGRMRQHLYARGALTLPPDGRWRSPDEDVRELYMLDEYGMTFSHVSRNAGHSGGLIALYGAVPETLLFARDFLSEQTARYFRTYVEALPDWHEAWGASSLRRESSLCFPTDSLQTFLANAIVMGASPQWLERHLDVPWQQRGDLYYIHKLVETIRAHQSAR